MMQVMGPNAVLDVGVSILTSSQSHIFHYQDHVGGMSKLQIHSRQPRLRRLLECMDSMDFHLYLQRMRNLYVVNNTLSISCTN